jgi:hypothetical protein
MAFQSLKSPHNETSRAKGADKENVTLRLLLFFFGCIVAIQLPFLIVLISFFIAGHLRNNESDNKADRHGKRYQYNLGHTHFPEKKP